jgi:hypothetical protein
VVAHRLRAQHEPLGDLPVVQPGRDQLQDLQLARRQVRERRRGSERWPELEVRRPSLQSRRVRGGWSDAYLPETTDPPNSRPLWALENVQWLALDGGLREWGIGLLAVLAFLDLIGGVALLMSALN